MYKYSDSIRYAYSTLSFTCGIINSAYKFVTKQKKKIDYVQDDTWEII
jgi:hypothetical protein